LKRPFVFVIAAALADGSTVPPVLNVADFSRFLNAFAVGCP
jgi:hypothetical protein